MSITFEITNNGVHASHATNNEFQQSMNINRGFVSMSENFLTINNINDDMPTILRVFDEVSAEINNSDLCYNDMAWAHICQPEKNNSNMCLEIHGTENAIRMIEHGMSQCDIETILWI